MGGRVFATWLPNLKCHWLGASSSRISSLLRPDLTEEGADVAHSSPKSACMSCFRSIPWRDLFSAQHRSGSRQRLILYFQDPRKIPWTGWRPCTNIAPFQTSTAFGFWSFPSALTARFAGTYEMSIRCTTGLFANKIESPFTASWPALLHGPHRGPGSKIKGQCFGRALAAPSIRPPPSPLVQPLVYHGRSPGSLLGGA